jgi:hypothetical protein
VKKTPREGAEARARRFLFGLKKSGAPMPDEALVLRLIDKSVVREEAADAARDEVDRILRERFAGCVSVTTAAHELGLKRAALFEWLEREGWLVRADNGNWDATDWAIAQGFAVSRGPAPIRYAQLTRLGRKEIARRLGLNRGAVGVE